MSFRKWTHFEKRMGIFLILVSSAGLAFCFSTISKSANVPRPIIKQLTLPGGLEYRYNADSLECFAFGSFQPLTPGWVVVDVCPPTTTQTGGPPYYGEVHITMPGILHVDAVRLWPLDFMPADGGCPPGAIIYVKDSGRAFLCTPDGWRALTLD